MNKNEKILSAKRRLAKIWQCDASAFDSDENIFIEAKDEDNYAKDNFFQMITFGKNAVVRGNKEFLDWVSEKFGAMPARFIMDLDNFYIIDEKLHSFGKRLNEEDTIYLHLFPERIPEKPLGFEYKWYNRDNIKELYEYKEFCVNALTCSDKDMLAVAAFVDGKPVSVAACDNWWDDLWQIGIDTLPEYQRRGLALYLVKELALEIERNGKTVYYKTWSANIASTRVALGSGFYPVWVSCGSADL